MLDASDSLISVGSPRTNGDRSAPRWPVAARRTRRADNGLPHSVVGCGSDWTTGTRMRLPCACRVRCPMRRTASTSSDADRWTRLRVVVGPGRRQGRSDWPVPTSAYGGPYHSRLSPSERRPVAPAMASRQATITLPLPDRPGPTSGVRVRAQRLEGPHEREPGIVDEPARVDMDARVTALRQRRRAVDIRAISVDDSLERPLVQCLHL